MKRRMIGILAAAMILPGAALVAQPVLITGIESDTVSAGFPPAAAGDWVKFGAAFDEMGITTVASEVDEGAQALYVGVSLEAASAWGMGIEYGLSAPIPDLSTKSVVSFRAKQSDPGAHRLFLAVVEADGDVWESNVLRNLTTDYATYSEDLSATLTLTETNGDGLLNLDTLAAIRFIVHRNGQEGLYSTIFLDEIYYDAHAAAPGALPLVTNIDPPDFYANGFPVGAEGEWTRFGSALADAGIIEDALEATSGSHYLQLDAAWPGFAGLRYVPRQANADWTGHVAVEFDIRTTNPAAGGQVAFYLEEGDGDIWVSGPAAVTATWETITLDFPGDFNIEDASGGGSFAINDIAQIGFTFTDGTASQSQSFLMDNIRLVEESVVPNVPPVLPVVTGMEPPDSTSGGFPPLPGVLGTEGEWTRFGGAYNGIFLVNDSAEATVGSYHLQLSANWEAGAIVGARHTPYDAPANWSAYDQIALDLRVQTALAGSTVTVALFEDDGDIWISPPIAPTTSWDRYSVPFSSLVRDTVDSTGDGVLAADEIVLWGLNFLNSGLVGQQNLLVDNVTLDGATSVSEWMIFN